MVKRRKLLVLALGLLMAVTMLVSCTSSVVTATAAPSLTTDKPDYAPGDTVIVSGQGFTPGATYDIPVIRPDGSIVKGDGTFSDGWDMVTADSSGGLLYAYQLDGVKGTYEVRAYNSPWSGSVNDLPVATVTFTDAYTATVVTTLSQSSVTIGDTVFDSVVVYGVGAGFPVPTGNIDFQVNVGGQGWVSFDNETLISDGGWNGTADSVTYMPLGVASYAFRAVYSGDANYSAAQSGDADEPLTTIPAPSAVLTMLDMAGTTQITLGDTVFDYAVVLSLNGALPIPTGMVDFQVSYNGGVWTTYDSGEILVDEGAFADTSSIGYLPVAAGHYDFRAVYNGDVNFNGSMSVNDSEPLEVLKAPSSILTLIDSVGTTQITLGDTVFDYAAVFALNGALPVPTGTVDFQVSFNGGAWSTYDSVEILVNETFFADATSILYQPVVPGHYDFRAVYSGDSNFNGSMSINDSEPLDVLKAPSMVLTLLNMAGTTQITLGDSVFDYAVVIGLNGALAVPGGTVDFQVSLNGGAWSTYDAGEPLTDEVTFADASSIAYQPMLAGHYDFRAIFNGDSNFDGSMSINDSEPLEVLKAPSMVLTLLDSLGTTQMTLGDMVFDYAAVFGLNGALAVPTGTVDFQVSFNGGSWFTYDAGEVLVNETTFADANSIAYQPLVAGHYDFRAIYSGDANFNGSMSINGSEPLEVLKAPSMVVTLLDSDGTTQITLGDTVFDYAAVFALNGALPVPTGTVDFQVSYNFGVWTTFDSLELLVNESTFADATSILYQPLAAGHYDFRAVYSGDSNFDGSMSINDSEPLEVLPAPTMVLTLLDTLGTTQITLGDSVFDYAVVIGLNGALAVPTGTVDFQVSYDNGTWMTYDAGEVLVNEGLFADASSIGYQPLLAGHYDFRAVYSGDTNFTGSMSINDSEPLQVLKAPTMVLTLLNMDGTSQTTLGDIVFDYAVVIALNGALAVPTGTVDFQVSFNGGAWFTYDSGEVLTNESTFADAFSIAYLPTAAGHYDFRAIYSGDSNFNGSMSINDSEPLEVLKAPTFTETLLDMAGTTQITLGDSVFDYAVVFSSGLLSTPTGTVDFQVSYNGGAWSTYDAGEALTDEGTFADATSILYQPLLAGHYDFRAIYNGDSNFDGSMSVNDSEPLEVLKAPSMVLTLLDTLGTTQITLGDSVFDYAVVIGLNGALAVPSGTVDFQVSYNGGAWSTYDAGEILVNEGTFADATSIAYQPLLAGHYDFRALYSGDSNFNGSMSINDSEPLEVLKAPTMVLTLINMDGTTQITLGDFVFDYAVVIALNGALAVPTGTVDFQVSFNGGAWSTYDSESLTDEIIFADATSIAYLPTAAGHYDFRAIYNGDSNFNGSMSINDSEPLEVLKAPTFTETLLNGGVTTTTLGDSVIDYAVVFSSGLLSAPTGTVDFQVSFNGGAWTTFDAGVALTDEVTFSDAYSTLYTPLVPGHYDFRAIYNGDSNFTGSMSINDSEPLEVLKAPSFVLTQLSLNSIVLGNSVTDYATVFALNGALPVPTGTVDFQVSFNGGAWSTYDAGEVLVNEGTFADATSIAYVPLAAGHYDFRAVYGGDSNFNGSMSINDSEPLEVGPAASTTATLLSSSTITLGHNVTDTVTVTGLGGPFPIPTGIVTFYVKAPGGSFVVLGVPVALVGGSATSISYTPLTTGTYYFKAVYGGDANYTGSASGNFSEPLSVGPAASTTTTVLSSVNITLGQSVIDTATVTGLGNGFPIPTGTVVFQVQIGNGAFTTFSTKALNATGVAVSGPYKPLATGSYHFRALYSGDSNYNASASGDRDEPLSVGLASSTTTTVLCKTVITLGECVTDKAIVTGLGGSFPKPTGTVTFYVLAPGGTWTQFGTPKTLVNGIAFSSYYKPLAAGTYYFKAVYGGDSNYNSSASGDRDEPLCVDRATPCVVTCLSDRWIPLGGSVVDTARVHGLGDGFPAPTGTVQFQYKAPGSSTWVTFDTKTLVAYGHDGVATSIPFYPTMSGTYYFRAVYSGDANYKSAHSGDCSEPLGVSNPPGLTIGFWKNNIQKHIQAWPCLYVLGTQVNLNDLKLYLWNVRQKYNGAFSDGAQWFNGIAPLGGSPSSVTKANLQNAYNILNPANNANMMLKARAQILSLLLTEQLRNDQAADHGGSPNAYSNAMVFIPGSITGSGNYLGTVSGAITKIITAYNAQNYTAAKNMADYLNNIDWSFGQPWYWIFP